MGAVAVALVVVVRLGAKALVGVSAKAVVGVSTKALVRVSRRHAEPLGLAPERVRCNRFGVIVQIHALVETLLAATSGSRERVQLGSRREVRLRLHERGSVIGHVGVAAIRVVAEDDNDSGDNEHQQQNQRKGSISNPQHDAHNASDESGLVKDLGEDHQKDRVDKVDGADGNVERVGALVHPWAKDAGGNQGAGFNDEKTHGLNGSRVLRKGDEHGLESQVAKVGQDEVIGGGSELHVEEAPLVKCLGVREEDIGRVVVHDDGAAGNHNHLEGGPAERGRHSDQEKDSQDHQGSRIVLGELPQAHDGHGREPDEGKTEQDALEDREPAVAEVEELVAVHHLVLDGHLAGTLESGHGQTDKNDHQAEEGHASHENVGRLDAGAEGHTLDPVHDVTAGAGLDIGATHEVPLHGLPERLSDAPRHHGHRALREAHTSFDKIQRSLLNLHGNGRKRVEDGGRSTTSGALVPGKDVLHELETNDSHAPLEILGPRHDNRRQRHTSETKHGLGLEVTKEREGVGSDVGSGIVVTETRHDSRRCESQTSDNGSSPLDTKQIHRLSVGNISLHASNSVSFLGTIRHGKNHLYGGVEIGEVVGDSRYLFQGVTGDGKVEVERNLACCHGTETSQTHIAWADFLLDDGETIGRDLDIESDVALD